MQDFTRIGGEIVSSPLNDNFRRLINAIDIANTNLIFPEQNGVVDTIEDMNNISNPDNAQTCYVISSGELYRYSKRLLTWVKIADFGQTFRQGFLNSGAVVLESYITLKENSTTVLSMPKMLVYFKNQPGDNRYLKGMYLIDAKELNVTNAVSGAGAYSISVNYNGVYSINPGMPSTDDPDDIYIGEILVDSSGNIFPHFVYTIPDIAFTADRGHFMLYGGEANGCNLLPSTNGGLTVNRNEGYYYDEGINFTIGQTSNYPVDTDNGSNYNLKHYNAKSPVDHLYYITPTGSLNNGIQEEDGLVIDKYWNGTALTDVPSGYYTIQQHLLTPNGQNIIVYGSTLYNSMNDAVSNLNSVYGIDIEFPYVEATRIALGNTGNFSSNNSGDCQFFTLGRLSQVGTISPQFADNVFKLYSGNATDITPASLRFSLGALENENFDGLFTLSNLPYNTTRQLFSMGSKYITDTNTQSMTQTQSDYRIKDDASGYDLADNKDLALLTSRVSDIEQEVWKVEDDNAKRYEQSVRFRLFNLETRADSTDGTLTNYGTRIEAVEKGKVNKGTTINGYVLGNTTEPSEVRAINLKTGDIAEGNGNNLTTNLWYTEARVNANTSVANATAHINTISTSDSASTHTKVNPHNISTDDLTTLTGTAKVFVTPEEERRIRSDKLPDNTIQALSDLDAKNLDSVKISYVTGRSSNPGTEIKTLGDAKAIKFYKDGVNISMDPDGETLILECVGQMNEDVLMYKSHYATYETSYPDLYSGYVDKAVNSNNATNVIGIDTAGNSAYYGTNSSGVKGFYQLPTYVSTAAASDYADINQCTFVPIDGSVQEKHLETTLKDKINNNFHSVYNGGKLLSSSINTFTFGDNISVSVTDNNATITAVAPGESTINNFANLADVNVTYTGNAGKAIIVNQGETGVEVSSTMDLTDFMTKTIYVDSVDTTKVKKAVVADTAVLSNSATNALAVNNKTVNNDLTTDAALWTASKIISNTSSQIASEGVAVLSGITAPSDDIGKENDIYILLES